MGKYSRDLIDLEKTNVKLVEELQKQDIKKVQMTSLGNSIAVGFSGTSLNCPLLLRNKNLVKEMNRGGIEININHLARGENNSDEKVFQWIIENKKISEFNKENQRDYTNWNLQDMAIIGRLDFLTQEEQDRYFPRQVEDDKGTADIIYLKEPHTANIVIANLGTGSLLDNWTRKGKHVLTTGIKKDRSYVESILGLIQLHNRDKFGSTQVYLCGAPRLFNTFVSNTFINNPIKRLSKQYANVTYIPNFSRQLLYPIKGKPPIPDPHYNEEEYLHLINEIEKNIIKNYIYKDALIEIDRELNILSKQVEFFLSPESPDDKILTIVENRAEQLERKRKNHQEFLEMVTYYLSERYPYDFSFLNRDTIKSIPKVLSKTK